MFAAERSALAGAADFRVVLSSVLARWGAGDRVDIALEAWHALEVDATALALVDELRSRGIRCFVASNQNDVRAAHMSQRLGFADRFDGELYSCHLGVVKPDPVFFRTVLDRAAVPAADAIFVDDSIDNVRGASSAGMAVVHADPSETTDARVSTVRDACFRSVRDA